MGPMGSIVCPLPQWHRIVSAPKSPHMHGLLTPMAASRTLCHHMALASRKLSLAMAFALSPPTVAWSMFRSTEIGRWIGSSEWMLLVHALWSSSWIAGEVLMLSNGSSSDSSGEPRGRGRGYWHPAACSLQRRSPSRTLIWRSACLHMQIPFPASLSDPASVSLGPTMLPLPPSRAPSPPYFGCVIHEAEGVRFSD